MTESKPAIWLFAISVQTPVARIARARRGGNCSHAVVLTAQSPFPLERETFSQALAPAQVEFVTLAELFDDSELSALDEATTAELLATPPSQEAFIARYEHLVTRKKNAAALERLQARYNVERCFCTAGPGLDPVFWRQQGAHDIGSFCLSVWLTNIPLLREARALRERLRRPPKTGTLLEDRTGRYLFLSKLHRLKLAPGTVRRIVPVRAYAARVDFVATTLHNHPAAANRLHRPVRVFADGFLPSNYPRSYLDSYGEVEFVGADPISTRWFRLCEKRWAPKPDFIVQEPFGPASAPRPPRTLVVLLGHAGDWTALVNRSDTDLLVEAASELARSLPNLDIVLRLHPTMDHPRHEGLGAQNRIRAFASATGLPNFSVSRETLDSDLARGDLFLSEYSATLLDVWRKGQPGLAVNLTRRRSFMQDFVDLGFPEATSVQAIIEAIDEIRTSPNTFATRQAEAANRYNALLHAERE